MRGGQRFHLALVTLLPKFPPKRVQHHLGQGTHPGILFDLAFVQTDAFFLFVGFHVRSAFLCILAHLRRPTRRLLLDLQKGVDVPLEKIRPLIRKVPHLKHSHNDVSFGHGCFQFRCAPRPRQRSLLFRVGAAMGSLGERERQLCLHARST